MSITVNANGTLKKLETVHANANGTIKNLNVIHSNVNGTLKKIFSYEDNPWVFTTIHTHGSPSGGGMNYGSTYAAVVGMDISFTVRVGQGQYNVGTNGTFSPKTNCKMIIDYTVTTNTTLHKMSIKINNSTVCSASEYNFNKTLSVTPEDEIYFLISASGGVNLAYTSDATLRIRLTS